VPKRGFRNTDFRTHFEVVNLSEIERVFAGSKDAVTVQALRDKGLLKGRFGVKVLGDGELKKGLTIEADAFSASAKEKIEKAGGVAELVVREIAPVVRHKNKKKKA
jgi:large subunit ribosomal protein L15